MLSISNDLTKIHSSVESKFSKNSVLQFVQILNLSAPIPQNRLTHSSNSSATAGFILVSMIYLFIQKISELYTQFILKVYFLIETESKIFRKSHRYVTCISTSVSKD